MKRRILLFLLLPAFILNIQGQDKNFKRIFFEAEYYFLTADYAPALRNYENLLLIDPDNANLNFLCGYCLMKTGGDIKRIISLLEKAIESANPSYKDGSYKERNTPMDAYFLLGRAYHINNQFDHAIETYSQYSSGIDKKDFAEIEYVNAHIKACELGKSMISNPVDVELQPLGSNIEFDWDIYNPVVSGNDSILIFLSDRNDRITIMMSEKKGNSWSKPLGINPQIGLAGNIYPASLSYDGTELYIVYNDYFNVDIYVSHHDGNRWSRAIKLNNTINTKYTESHACVSRDGSRLYFTSDRKGGIGGLDIYVSERISGDEWGEAMNLGHSINTYYNEESPFLTKDDQWLFFSSQGHNTMGGYDIFFCNSTPEGSWNIPMNIGYPVNTTDDDLFFNPGWKDGQAFYAMKTEDAGEYLKIYNIQLSYMEDLFAEAGTPEYEKLPEEVATDSSAGEASNDLMALTSESATNPVPLVATQKPKVTFSSLGIYYILNNIQFDYNESSINEKTMRDVERIYMLMRKYPEIRIELTGHTDAKGTREYNLKLSNNRAHSVANYLISNGIDTDRISVKAAGELDPVAINQYEDGSDAPEGRELNRHVSIKITNLSSDKIRVADIFVPNDLIPKEDKGYTVILFQSTGRVTVTPEVFLDEQVSMISTDNSYMYTAGQFDKKTDAVRYLNDVIDVGYPDARIIERRSLEHLIRDNSTADPFDPVCYTIQIMALKRPRDVSYFKNLAKVKRYECKDGLYRFVTGEYEQIEDALKELPGIRRKGYRAFIMPCSRYVAMTAGK